MSLKKIRIKEQLIQVISKPFKDLAVFMKEPAMN
jgi:hypothetical protein